MNFTTLLRISSALPLLFANSVQAESCLVPTRALERIQTSAGKEPANATHSVLRPCRGQVREGRAPVIYGVGDGIQRELPVGSGEYIEQRISASLGPNKRLADIWPKSTVLAALRGLLAGERRSVVGSSGFDGASKGFSLVGSIVIVEDFPLPLAVFGLDPTQPVVIIQGPQRVQTPARDGTATLPLTRFAPGPATIEQGSRRQAVKLVELSQEAELQAALLETVESPGDPGSVSLRRALAFQEAEYPINAIVEAMKNGGAQ